MTFRSVGAADGWANNSTSVEFLADGVLESGATT
jgi:hypothetical protein